MNKKSTQSFNFFFVCSRPKNSSKLQQVLVGTNLNFRNKNRLFAIYTIKWHVKLCIIQLNNKKFLLLVPILVRKRWRRYFGWSFRNKLINNILSSEYFLCTKKRGGSTLQYFKSFKEKSDDSIVIAFFFFFVKKRRPVFVCTLL